MKNSIDGWRPSCMGLSVGMFAALCAADAAAQSTVVQPRVSIGVQDYQLHFDDVILPLANGGHDFRAGFKVDDRLPFIGAGLNFSVGRAFADFSGQWSQNGSDHGTQFEGVAIGPGLYTSGDGLNHRSDAEFHRQELNVTLGWGATANLSLYGGYKHATVDLTQTLTPILSPPPFVDVSGGRDGDVLFTGTYEMQFTYSGAFAGVTYSVPVSAGAFSFQSSLAYLDGAFEQRFFGNVSVTNPNSPNSLRSINPTFKDGQIEGQSFGLNVGISWTGDFAWLGEGLRKLSYTIGIDHSQYKFDSGKSNSLWAADLQERNTRARLDLSYRFGQTGS
jgi:hypothetical protein